MAIDPRITDFSTHACQYSDSRAIDQWNFMACMADDFRLETSDTSVVNYRLTRMVSAYHFYQTTEQVDPNIVEGMFVLVFKDSNGEPAFLPREQELDKLYDGTHPGGSIFDDDVTVVSQPTDGTRKEDFPALPDGLQFYEGTVAMEWVPKSKFNSITDLDAPECRGALTHPCNRFQFDFDLDLIVGKNTNYWITAMPGFVAPPQTAWLVSNKSHVTPAQVIATFEGYIWSEFDGNDGSDGSQPGAFKNLAFDLYGKKRSLE